LDTDEINVEISDQEILELSQKIEKQGEAIYNILAKKISDPKIKAFFQKLAKEEAQHEKQFAKLLGDKSDRPYGWERKKDVRDLIQRQLQTDIFPDIEKITQNLSDYDAIQKAIDFALDVERTSAEFYSLLCEYCTNFEAKTLLAMLENAEMEHLKAIENLKSQLLT
jgi:rubrerythrin